MTKTADTAPNPFAVQRNPHNNNDASLPWPRNTVLVSQLLWQAKTRRSFVSNVDSLFMMSAQDDDEDDFDSDGGSVVVVADLLERAWNITGLKKEVGRLKQRCYKKIGKANQRLATAKEREAEIETGGEDANPNGGQGDDLASLSVLEFELDELKTRLAGLNQLEEDLQSIKKKKCTLQESTIKLIKQLNVSDQPSPPVERGPKKTKGPRTEGKSRLPYRRYFSYNNVEIRVGKKAEDNDQLTMSPLHRDNADWWMHASGCPGSHVVIRWTDEQVPDEVVQDAAALAARQSKCTGSVIKVSMTRCRDIRKPPMAKAGLVQLVGSVRTITVNMQRAQERLDRLDQTVLIN